MNYKKKQTVAVAMATALSVSAMMSPMAVHAQEEDLATVIIRETASQQTQEDEDSTQEQGASMASETDLAGQTDTEDETTTSYGAITIEYSPLLVNGSFPDNHFAFGLPIPLLIKEEEVAIDEANFPDPIFRTYVKDKFDKDRDGVLSKEEISKVTNIHIGNQNIRSLEGIEHFDALKSLWCPKTAITELNISNNTNLTMLDCGYTNISNLDIRNNRNLTSLNCSGTKIKDLNISENTALTTLYCANMTISELDISNNSYLTLLNVSDTFLNELDTSNNINLETLWCFRTKLTSLDINKNTKLKKFDCTYTPLAWLNLGIQGSLGDFKKSNSEIDVLVTDSTFHITDLFEGITPEKIDENTVTGAVYNKETGVMSGHIPGTSITYTYDCGTAEGIPQKLNVTLNLSKLESKIFIENSLDKEYTGKPYEIPEIRTEGSKGEVTFTYSEYSNGSYKPIVTAPTSVGRYAVQIELAEDEYHKGAITEQTAFEISQAKNCWVKEPAITDWKVGDMPNAPTATAKFGDAVFTYSDSENGVYTSKVPAKEGTWYVKATVTGTENYAGLEDTKSFLIREAEPIIPNQPDESTNPEEPGQPVKPDNSEKPNQMTESDQPMKPENSNDQETSDIPDKPVEMVETSDTSQSGILAVLSILSGGCIAVLLRKKKKSNED